MKVMDKINTTFGKDTLKIASSGTKQNWSMKSQYISQGYTTNWNELLTIKI